MGGRTALRKVASDVARSDTSAARASNQDRVQADGAQGDPSSDEGLTLSTQSSEDLKGKAAREDAASKADAAEQKRLADKAKADAEVDEFTLTGSNRAVDVGAATGQGGLFDVSTESAAKPAAPNEADALKKKALGTTDAVDKNIKELTTDQAAMKQEVSQPEAAANEFIQALDGSIDYSEITPEMLSAMRRQAVKIRLKQGVRRIDGTGYRLAQIEIIL